MTIDISLRAILKVLGTLLGIGLIYLVRDIVVLFFFVIILVMAMNPIIEQWQKKTSRPMAVSALFFAVVAIISLIIGLIVPPLISQSLELANNLPTYAKEIEEFVLSFTPANSNILQEALNNLSGQISALSRNLITATLGIIGGFVTLLTVIVLSIYLLLEENGVEKFFTSLMPHGRKDDIADAINKIGSKLGAWLRGELLLMFIIGAATTIWVALLGLPFALPLGLWAGLMEVLPFIGSVFGAIPIVIIALLDSPIKGLIALALIVVMQQIEATLIVPKVMQKSVGLSPVIIILALLAGAQLFGIVGAILAIPIAATVSVIIQEWPKLSKAFNK